MQYLGAVLLLMGLLGCAEKNTTSSPHTPPPQTDLLNVNVWDTANAKTNHEILALANKKLAQLVAIPDSLPAYIKLNDKIYNFIANLEKDSAFHQINKQQYLNNIIRHHESAISDTALRKILIDAYFWSGCDRYTPSYDDSVVKSFEQFMLLVGKYDPRHDYISHATIYLGILYNILGDLKKAFYVYHQACLNAKAEGNNDNFASGVINATIALNELHLYDSSIRMILETLPLRKIQPKRIALLYGNLATAQAGKKLYREAISNAQLSLEMIEKILSVETERNLEAKRYQLFWNLGEIQLASGNLAAAADTLNRALDYAMQFSKGSIKDREIGKIFIVLGQAAEKMEQLPLALTYYHKALSAVTDVDSSKTSQLPLKEKLYKENTIMEALDAKAGVLLKIYATDKDAGKLVQAIKCYDLAFEVEKKLMQGFDYDESLNRQAKESRNRSEKAIEACYRLLLLTNQPSWAEQAFYFAERSKAMVLQRTIRKNIAANHVLQYDTLWQKVQQLQQVLSYYEKKIYMAAKDDSVATASFNREKYKVENELLAAKTALLHSKNYYNQELLQTDSLSLKTLKGRLPGKNVAIAEFFEGQHNIWSFIITKDQPVQLLQYDSLLSKQVEQLIGFFSSPSSITNEPLAFQQSAFNVYSRLQWKQMDKDWDQLIIIPDGRLSFLPFDALVMQASGTLNLQQIPYLLYKYETSYAYSAAILLKQMEHHSSKSRELVVFAPVFAYDERSQRPLPNTLTEVTSIRNHATGTFFMASEATLSNFRKALPRAGILHIATHAYADTAVTTLPRIEFIDSSLLLNELYALQTNASLVVLSGCETGIGQIDQSEGAMSLARGFYYGGAGNVITSYWNVDDKSTATLFENFYKNIDDHSYAAALHYAKREYIKTTPGMAASPFYWAGFVHIGYPQQDPSAFNWWWMLLLPILLPAAIFFYRKFRA